MLQLRERKAILGRICRYLYVFSPISSLVFVVSSLYRSAHHNQHNLKQCIGFVIKSLDVKPIVVFGNGRARTRHRSFFTSRNAWLLRHITHNTNLRPVYIFATWKHELVHALRWRYLCYIVYFLMGICVSLCSRLICEMEMSYRTII